MLFDLKCLVCSEDPAIVDCERFHLSHQLPDEGSSFRAVLPIVNEKTRLCSRQNVQNITKDLLDRW